MVAPEQHDSQVGSHSWPPLLSRSFATWRKNMILSTGLGFHSELASIRKSSNWPIRDVAESGDKAKVDDGGEISNLPEQLSEEEEKKLTRDCRRCEAWRDEVVRESPIVRFLISHISHLPPTSPSTTNFPTSLDEAPPLPEKPDHLPLPIVCIPCPNNQAGGFAPGGYGVMLCQDRLMDKKHVEDTLSHELIHEWDERRFKVDWSNLRHHACSEIRAASLSGDCRWGREIKRGHFGFTKQHQACTKRRAILSVASNPACPDVEAAERTVNEVWESCWRDTRPFDEIYK